MIRLTLSDEGDLIKKIRRQKKNIRIKTREALNRWGDYMLSEIDWMFQNEGGRGVFWPDRKGEESYLWPKLNRLGDLRASIKTRARAEKVRHGVYYNRLELYQDESEADYGWRHQGGDPDKNVPARPFMFITEEDQDYAKELLLFDLDESNLGLVPSGFF